METNTYASIVHNSTAEQPTTLSGVVMPSVAVAAAAAAVMGPANWIFISCLGWGLAGAAASYFVGSLASLAVIVAFIVHLERTRPLEARCA